MRCARLRFSSSDSGISGSCRRLSRTSGGRRPYTPARPRRTAKRDTCAGTVTATIGSATASLPVTSTRTAVCAISSNNTRPPAAAKDSTSRSAAVGRRFAAARRTAPPVSAAASRMPAAGLPPPASIVDLKSDTMYGARKNPASAPVREAQGRRCRGKRESIGRAVDDVCGKSDDSECVESRRRHG